MRIINYFRYWALYIYYLIYVLCQMDFSDKQGLREIKAMMFSLRIHHSVRQRYGKWKPYFWHTLRVYRIVCEYSNNVDWRIAALLHDVIEDCRLTYNDVVKLFGKNVADIVFACSNEKGKNRSERTGLNFYSGIRAIPGATVVKIADRTANAEEGLATNGSMLSKLRKEHPHFQGQLYNSAEALTHLGLCLRLDSVLSFNHY